MSAANQTPIRLLALFQSTFCGLLPALCCLLPHRAAAEPADGPPISQRRINELAASLQRARFVLIENTGLRRPQEPLPAYFVRIVGEGPGETGQARQGRIAGYIATVRLAASDTATIRVLPVLRHNDAGNLQQWQRAIRALDQLPARVKKISSAWQAAQQEEKRNWQSPDLAVAAAPYRRLGAELTEATELILVAYNALRDAKP